MGLVVKEPVTDPDTDTVIVSELVRELLPLLEGAIEWLLVLEPLGVGVSERLFVTE